MNKIYKSLYGQMVFVIIAGLQLLFIPNVFFAMFGIPTTSENWIRLMGLLVLILSIYYYFLAKYGNDKVVWGTVLGRLAFCFGEIIMVVLGLFPPIILAFAVVETSLTIWTWRELK